jgi:hypothetical protein
VRESLSEVVPLVLSKEFMALSLEDFNSIALEFSLSEVNAETKVSFS